MSFQTKIWGLTYLSSHLCLFLQIERLQEENTCEWGRRERLETEKLQLERENKRLKTSADEMQTEMERRRKTTAEDRDHELQHAQIELHDLNEVLYCLQILCYFNAIVYLT